MKIMVALHHHRHGVDTYLFDLSLANPEKELAEEDIIKFLGEEFEEDRDEWVELRGPYSQKDIVIV